MGGLTQLIGEAPERVHRDLDARRIGHGPRDTEAMFLAHVLQFLVADCMRKGEELLRHHGAGHVVGSLRRHPVPVEHERQRHGIAEPSRHRERLVCESDPALAQGFVADGGRESREQQHPLGTVSFPHRLQRTLEERDECGVAAGARPREPPAVGEGGPRELVGPAGALG